MDNDLQLLVASGLVVMIGILTVSVVTSVEPSAMTTRQRTNTNLARLDSARVDLSNRLRISADQRGTLSAVR